uniref:Uncharacterized protein n=1 Tax=Arundo donax TaxID=35708 RepID=A0A0A9DIP6_ARUDO
MKYTGEMVNRFMASLSSTYWCNNFLSVVCSKFTPLLYMFLFCRDCMTNQEWVDYVRLHLKNVSILPPQRVCSF